MSFCIVGTKHVALIAETRNTYRILIGKSLLQRLQY